MSLAELIEFEKRADASVAGLPFWKQPVRVVLTGMYALIDQMIHGPVDGSDRAWVAGGETVASRLSYLSPLIAQCPAEPIHSAIDSIELFNQTDPGGPHGRELLSYAHLCELMPEARKKHYTITRRPGGFDLTLPTAEFEAAERKDVLLSELAIGFRDGPRPKVSLRAAILTGWLKVDPSVRGQHFAALHTDIMAELYEFSYRVVVEPPILSHEGFVAAVGCGLEDFVRFRSAMLALADFCQVMGQWHRGELQMGSQSPEVTYEYGEWASVCWREDFFFQSVRQMAGLTEEQCRRLLDAYSIDLTSPEPVTRHSRDGFFPPVWWLPGHVLFNADVLARLVSSRNLAFVMNRLDEDRFAAVVSEHLEPQLIRTALDILAGAGDGVECVPDIAWGVGVTKGQIDLLVYFPADNVVWHVQAKGALPPQGARMIFALEERVDEALKQLERFRKLPEADRNRIMSAKLGRKVAPARMVDVVLLRACAGTARVWEKKGDRVFLTLPVLVELVNRVRSTGTLTPLVDCAAAVDDFIAWYVASTSPHWVRGSITLAGEEITMPLLKFDAEKVDEVRKRIWAGTEVGRGRDNPWKVVPPAGSNIVVVPAGTAPKRPQTQDDQIRHALRLMDHHSDWEEKRIGKASGLHSTFLRQHPLTGPVLDLLERYRRKKTRGK